MELNTIEQTFMRKRPAKDPNRVIHYFPNTDLRCNHKGLGELARKAKIVTMVMGAGEFLLFVNRRQTGFKLLAPNNVLVYQKVTSGRLHPRVFTLLPKYFNGGELDFQGATREAITRDFKEKTIH